MRTYFNRMALVVVLTLLSGASAFGAENPKEDAVATMVQGTARVFSKDSSIGRILKKGDLLKKEDTVKTARKSRLEISFPDGTLVRLGENSTLQMREIAYNRQTEGKNIKVNLSTGKLWAKVKKFTTTDSSVVVETSNAVAGVRGTVYRVNVEDDQSALIRVYDGSVYVANPPKDTSGRPAKQVQKPTEVPGPHQVPPPYHEVTMEEWTVIVQAMQQVSVSPQGIASQPQNFDPKADMDDWVLWNQKRDTLTTF